MDFRNLRPVLVVLSLLVAPLAAGAAPLPYVNPEAPKGGELHLGVQGTFDQAFPFGAKGEAPQLVRTLVYQSLAERSWTDPAGFEPALAEVVAPSADGRQAQVSLHEEARFSDGHPVEAADVVWSWRFFHSEAASPFLRAAYAPLRRVDVVDAHTVLLTLAGDGRFALLAALTMPILERGDDGRSGRAVGSGPYVVERLREGDKLTLRRDPAFWGRDLPLSQGRDNLDRIHVAYFHDETALLEDLKRGDLDYYWATSSKAWVKGLADTQLAKELWPHRQNLGTQAFYLNLDRPALRDVRVRKALALAFDFDWCNRVLFYDQYRPNTSVFENSPMAAHGLPDAAERAVLAAYAKDLPPGTLTEPVRPIGEGLSARGRLLAARQLLADAGYHVVDGVATGPGGRLDLRLLLEGPSAERYVEPYAAALARLGVRVRIERVDPSLRERRLAARDFDIVGETFVQPQIPGAEQRDYWSSAAADEPASRNLANLRSPVVDALVERLAGARTIEETELYARCLDRVLFHLHVSVPQWHAPAYRVALSRELQHPHGFPAFYDPWDYVRVLWRGSAAERRSALAH